MLNQRSVELLIVAYLHIREPQHDIDDQGVSQETHNTHYGVQDHGHEIGQWHLNGGTW